MPEDGDANVELLTFGEVADLLKTSKEAVRKMLYKASGNEELPAVLRRYLVRLGDRRRYVSGKPFRTWLRSKIAEDLHRNANADRVSA